MDRFNENDQNMKVVKSFIQKIAQDGYNQSNPIEIFMCGSRIYYRG